MSKKLKISKPTKKTVGAIASELQQKPLEMVSPVDIQRATEKEYLQNLGTCIQNNLPLYNGDFYVVVITKNEKLLHNVLRCYFLARPTCPTPDYDQTVFFFRRASQDIEYLWTIPDKESCLVYIANAAIIPKEEQQLLDNILKFRDGSLFTLCKKLNNEEHDSPLLIK